jgi:hypothetical protein
MNVYESMYSIMTCLGWDAAADPWHIRQHEQECFSYTTMLLHLCISCIHYLIKHNTKYRTATDDPARLPAQLAGRWGQMDWIVRATLMCTEDEFMDEIQIKVLRVFLLAIRAHLYAFALRFLFLKKPRNLLQNLQFVTVHWKGERRKTR